MLVSDAAQSSGNIMRRMADLERQLRELQAGRRLEAATVGAGGIRIKDGGRLIIDAGGQIQVGDITISSNAIDVAATGKINLLGTGEIQVGDIKISPNAINVAAAGSINISEGRLNVRDASSNVIVEVGKTSDARYGLRVNNAAGVAQVRAGQLAAGGHGLEAVDAAGKLVTLSTLAFGIRSATVATFQTTTSTTFTDLTTVGPTIADVPIGTFGRALVFVSAFIDTHDTDGNMSFTVSGATTKPAAFDRALTSQVEKALDPDVLASISMTRVFLLDDLNAGNHTFTAKYATNIGTNDVGFSDRNLTVIPF